MSDLRTLYQEVIIDHGRHPRNFTALADATQDKEGFNPLCGDRVHVYLKLKNDLIESVSFQGSGCAISMASASMMTQSLKGKTLNDAHHLFEEFQTMVKGGDAPESLGKLAVLKGVCEFPSRIKCATLCWHTALAALDHDTREISTE